MTFSLRTRWILALAAVCVLEAVLVAVAVRVTTERAFERFVMDETLEAFIGEMAGPGAGRPLGDGGRGGQRPPGGPPPPSQLGRDISFGFVDAEGRVVRAFEGYALGDVLSTDQLAEGRPVTVEGRLVGTVFEPEDLGAALAGFPSTSPEARFISSATAALMVALMVALLIAVATGAWLSGRTVRPLLRLTEAAKAIAGGDLGHSVEVEGSDEVGALAEAFNSMSARMAESDALRRRMTSDVSHDLRTPITAILGTLELIESGALEPTPKRIRTARIEAERLARLVENLHTLALADAGELPVHPATIAVHDLLRQTAAAFEPKATAAGVEIVLSDPPLTEVQAYADHDRLAQVFANLVSNAVRHTPSGGRVSLSAGIAPEGVHIAVTDTGSGIPADVLPTVFERSVRADRSRSGEGAGLGLSIVKSLVEAMGGTVHIANSPEGGTRALVCLPRGLSPDS